MPDLKSMAVMADEELEKRLLPGKKTILYVGIKYDYGHPELGLSYEHYNFYRTFLNMGYSLIYFDYCRLLQKYGQTVMSRMLLEAVYYYNPDILFYFNFHDWVRYDVWKEITNKLPTKTIIWLADDHWRYDETKPIWELFNLIVTTDKNGYKRRAKDYNVLLSQWACDHSLYRKLDLPKIYDTSFAGRYHGGRRQFVETLRKNDIDITTSGQGWNNNGSISRADLVKIYNQSKIVLNISLSSKRDKVQIKGRDFEGPGCGSLLLTQESEEIKEYFVPGKEIATYEDVNDAAEKIKFYLNNEIERENIAKAGYNKVIRCHTYEKRLKELLL